MASVAEFNRLRHAAYDLGCTAGNGDWLDDDILIYAAEWCSSKVELDDLNIYERMEIINEYEKGYKEHKT